MLRIMLALTCAALLLRAAGPDDLAIRTVLTGQVAAWNRGDVRSFMTGYENSPDTTFVGSAVARGYDKVLARYLKTYPTKERMGTLSFSDLEVRMLGAEYATVLGRFHLERNKEAGGPAQGIFTLLFKKTEAGWKIIQDHTSS